MLGEITPEAISWWPAPCARATCRCPDGWSALGDTDAPCADRVALGQSVRTSNRTSACPATSPGVVAHRGRRTADDSRTALTTSENHKLLGLHVPMTAEEVTMQPGRLIRP